MAIVPAEPSCLHDGVLKVCCQQDQADMCSAFSAIGATASSLHRSIAALFRLPFFVIIVDGASMWFRIVARVGHGRHHKQYPLVRIRAVAAAVTVPMRLKNVGAAEALACYKAD